MTVVASEQMDSCGKREAAVDIDSPEQVKKSKLDTTKEEQSNVEIKSFDPSFGMESAGQKQAVVEEAENESEENESDESGDDSQVDEENSDADASSNILEELISMFKEQNGRDPTEQEVKMWVDTLKEHVNETLVGQDSHSGDQNDKDVEDKGKTKHSTLLQRGNDARPAGTMDAQKI
jgi:hypothetical protein